MQATFEVLQNPSKARKFFQKLSRIFSPAVASEKGAGKEQAPPVYSTQPSTLVDSELKTEEEMPDLEVLKQRIEELARELDKVSQMANEMRTRLTGTITLNTSSRLQTKTRQCPPKDQISFFACTFPQLCI